MEDHILIRFGELSLKKANRKQFTTRIENHIKRALKKYTNLTYENRGMRFYIHLNETDSKPLIPILQQIPGLYSFSIVSKCETKLEDICHLAKNLVQKEYEKGAKTFKIETNRGDKKFPLTSIEITKEVGRSLFKDLDGIKADMYHPDFILFIDLRSEGSFLFTNIYKGLGGFPAGSLGKTTLMISGGIDSIVAGYLAIKKGMTIEAIHFSSPPYTADLAVQKVIDLLEVLTPYTEYSSINLYVVPFTKIQKAIYDEVRDDYCITIMRRMMYRLATRLSLDHENLALINGENVGQVASQTLESMRTIEEVTNMPVIRPLATFDKQDIVDLAIKIKTYDISILPYEDCCTVFVPKHPQIKPRLNDAKNEENKFNYQILIDEAYENIERIVLKKDYHYDYLTKTRINKNQQDDLF